MTPSGMRGVLNDAVSLYFADATPAGAFVTGWFVGSKVEAAGGVFQVRENEPALQVGAGPHRTHGGSSRWVGPYDSRQRRAASNRPRPAGRASTTTPEGSGTAAAVMMRSVKLSACARSASSRYKCRASRRGW
jgi:hypothetical protein